MINWNNRKMGETRLYWSKEKGKKSPSVLIKCRDCDNSFRICYDKEKLSDNWTEIAGVMATNEFWKELFKKINVI